MEIVVTSTKEINSRAYNIYDYRILCIYTYICVYTEILYMSIYHNECGKQKNNWRRVLAVETKNLYVYKICL